MRLLESPSLEGAARAAAEALMALERRPAVLAIDGPSGAGKSTLAAAIEKKLDAALIPVDDFFPVSIPDGAWDRFTVKERLEAVIDWPRLRRRVLEPLLAGREARWRTFDFAAGLRPDGTYALRDDPERRPPKPFIILDGAYSARPELSDLINLTLLVDLPKREREARLRGREDTDFLARWHPRWDPVERRYFSQVRPPESFDLVWRPAAWEP